MFGVPAAIAFALVRQPARFALALASLLAAGSLDPGPLGETLHMERNFFGVVRVDALAGRQVHSARPRHHDPRPAARG